VLASTWNHLNLYFPQFDYPGTRVDDLDAHVALTTEMLLHALETSFVDAAVSLDMCQSASAELQQSARKFKNSPRQDRLPFIFVKSFVLALYDTEKSTGVLTRLNKGTPEVAAA